MKTLIIGMGNIGVMHGWVLSESGAGVIGTALYMGGLPGKDTGIETWVLPENENMQ